MHVVACSAVKGKELTPLGTEFVEQCRHILEVKRRKGSSIEKRKETEDREKREQG